MYKSINANYGSLKNTLVQNKHSNFRFGDDWGWCGFIYKVDVTKINLHQKQGRDALQR